MAVDWVKMRTELYRDPKVCVIADLLMHESSDLSRYVSQNCQCDMRVTRNVIRNAIVGSLVSVWGVSRHRGTRVDDDLLLPQATLFVLDDMGEMPGLGKAMASVGWAKDVDDGVLLPAFFNEFNAEPVEDKRHKDAERQRKYRDRKKADDLSRSVTRNVTREGEGEGEGEGEDLSHSRSIHKGDRKIGASSNGQSRGDRSPMKNREGRIDTSEVDWGVVVARALAVAKLVPPVTLADRRAWLRYATLSTIGQLSEHWLISAAHGVVAAPRSTGKPQGHFVQILKATAAEKGIDPATLLGMASKIEVPDDVWGSSILPVKGIK